MPLALRIARSYRRSRGVTVERPVDPSEAGAGLLGVNGYIGGDGRGREVCHAVDRGGRRSYIPHDDMPRNTLTTTPAGSIAMRTIRIRVGACPAG
jgi:hypothetical protein